MAEAILVTGAAGFIGRNAALEFSRAGLEVYGIDMVHVDDRFCSAWGIDSFIAADLLKADIDGILRCYSPEVIIHCAGSASVPFSIAHPARDFQASAAVFFRIMDSVRRIKPECRMILVSSAAVYGNPQYLPIDETHPLQPISPYGYHRLVCETIMKEFHDIYAIEGCTVRVFSAYGEGLDRQVLWDICQKASAGGSVELFGTGHETRDFIHVKDIARALRLLSSRSGFRADIYNLASGKEISISEIATKLAAKLNPSAEVTFTNIERKGDPSSWRADISRISALGFSPSVLIDEGLDLYARYFLGLSGHCQAQARRESL